MIEAQQMRASIVLSQKHLRQEQQEQVLVDERYCSSTQLLLLCARAGSNDLRASISGLLMAAVFRLRPAVMVGPVCETSCLLIGWLLQAAQSCFYN